MAAPAFTIEQARKLRDRYEAGETTIQLAKEYGVGDGCVASWIKRAGGIIRSNSESKRKYFFDESFWDNIDTEHKAYWLGFFLADGYIGKYGGKWRNFWCTLAAKDGHHLDVFLKDIKSNNKTRYHKRGEHEKARILLTSIPFVNKLIGMGWIDFKSGLNHRIVKYIPDALLHHFVRGFFDGDGSIGKQHRKKRKSLAFAYSITIVAPPEHHAFLEWMRQLIVSEVGVSDKNLKIGSSVYRCHWNGNQQVKRIGEWMCRDATVYLQRKKDRFDELSNPIKFEWSGNNEFSCSHSPKDIAALPEEQQEKLIDEFCRLVMKSKWMAPQYTHEQLVADYRAAKIYNNNLYRVVKNNTLVGFRLNTGGSLESPTKKIVLHYQPQFWDVKTSKPPISQQWRNEGIVRRATKALLTTGTKISLARYLREMRYAGAAITSHFHANFACAILQNLAPEAKTWFDSSMGWGGRLIASKILDIEYEGCDPQPETYDGLLKIRDFIGSEATLYNIKAQDYKFEKEFDVCFTSPPFFNKEKYGGEEQSYFEFPRFDQWMVEFLCPLIDKLLNNCKKVIFHVDNIIHESLSKLYSFDQYPLYLQKNPGGKGSTEFIIVFNK